MIERREDGAVTVLRLQHGKANALDVELLRALDGELEAAAAAGQAIVVTGSGSIFSAGVDLFRLLADGPGYLDEFLPALDRLLLRLFTFPRPAVAAVNGHALAGGWVVAAACDYRIVAKGAAKIGLPELQVGVPFPPTALETVRFATPPAVLQPLVLAGRLFRGEEAQAAGLAEEAVAPEHLLARALVVARDLARIPAESFRLTKAQLRAPFLERAIASSQVAAEVRARWGAPETADVVRAYLARTIGKGGG